MLRITTDDYLFTKSFFLMFSKKSIVFILSFVFVSFVSAQNNIPDTLTQAKQQIAKGNIKEANEMLVLYISKHPKELNTLWLNAQCNYWLNNFTAAKACYKNAMQLFPDNYYLQLDYAKMLIQIGAYNEGEVLLKKYLSYDPEDTTSLYYLAKLNYWQGNYNDALNWTKKIITKNPNHEGANNINTEIALLKGTQLEIKSSYYSDNQPMQILSDGITVSKHFNSIFSPIFSFQNTQITVHDTVRSANTFQLSNQFNLYKLKSVVTTSLGFIMSPVGSHNFIGSIAVEKKLTPRLSFSIAGEGYQYFISAESVSKNIVANKFAFTGSYNNKNFITAKIGYENNVFEDHNNVDAIDGWALGPQFKFSIFEMRFGYAYNYSSSSKNLCTHKLSQAAIIAAAPDKPITVYYPTYFTPQHQVAHSILGNINAVFSTRFSLSINGSIGFIASRDVLNFFINYVNLDVNKPFVDKRIYNETFMPLELKAQALYTVNPKTSVQVNYHYNNGFFFTCNQISLGIKTNFVKALKK